MTQMMEQARIKVLSSGDHPSCTLGDGSSSIGQMPSCANDDTGSEKRASTGPEDKSKESLSPHDGRLEATAGYFPVTARSLIPGTALPVDIIVPPCKNAESSDEVPPLAKGAIIPEGYTELLLRYGIQTVYIDKDGHDKYQKYLTTLMESRILNKSISFDSKIQLVYDAAEYIVRRAALEKPVESDVLFGRLVIDSAAFIFTTHDLSAESLCSFFSRYYQLSSHSVHVAFLGMCFCRHLKWERSEIADWGLGALFHDIGKGFMGDKMLVERSRLKVEEFEVMKKHTTLGHQRMKSLKHLSADQLSIVLYHHELMDGSGYPEGLQGYQIHKFARIARIIDHYDTLVTKQPHRTVLTSSQAIEAMQKEVKSSFDEQLFNSFSTFMGFGTEMNDATNGKRISIELGSELLVQLVDEDIKFKSVLVGMRADEYLILRSPDMQHIRSQVYEGRRIIARCVHSGTVYGFRSKILCNLVHPAVRLLILEYPRKVECVNIRKNPRVDCHLPAEIYNGKSPFACAITDISIGGCKLVMKSSESREAFKAQVDQNITIRTPLLGMNDGEALTGLIRSVRADGNMVIVGVNFINLGENVLGALNRFIDSVLSTY